MSLRDRLNLSDLDNLLDETDVEIKEAAKVLSIPKHSIYSVEQVRTEFDAEKLKELSLSIEVNGQEQAISVYPLDGKGYKIQSGERRWRAIMLSDKLTHVNCVIRTKADIFSQLIENIQREQLTVIEQARAFAKAKKEYHLDNRQLASRLGKSESYISKHLQALNAPKRVLEAVDSGKINDVEIINTLRTVAKKSPELVEELLQTDKPITRKEANEAKAQSGKKKKVTQEKVITNEKSDSNLITELIECVELLKLEAKDEITDSGDCVITIRKPEYLNQLIALTERLRAEQQ